MRRIILVAAGFLLLLGGVVFYLLSPLPWVPPTRYTFLVEDSSTRMPLYRTSISVVGEIPGGGTVPLGTWVTAPNGSASVVASTRLDTLKVSRQGYQTFSTNNIPDGTSYLILLGNGTSSLSATNSKSGITLSLPLLSSFEWVGVLVAVGGAILICAAVGAELARKRA